jgi:hypothetical protein
VHLDGYNQLPLLTGQQPHSARNEFAYFNDDGVLVAYRLDDWKAVFVEMKYPGGFQVWQEPFTVLRVPKLFHLRMDPYERADIVSDQYFDWLARNDFKIAQLTSHAAVFLQTFVDYPPSQEQASFSIDQIAREVEEKIKENGVFSAESIFKLERIRSSGVHIEMVGQRLSRKSRFQGRAIGGDCQCSGAK